MRTQSRRPSHLLCAALLLAAPSSTLSRPLLAQTAGLGSIAGVVRDAGGANVPGATVAVTNLGTGARRDLVTDAEGHYEATFLQPGRYEVLLAGGTGFGTIDNKSITVTVGAVTTLNATLPAATVNTEVQVTADQPLLDTEKVEQSQVIGQELVSNVPVNSRRFESFVLLTPNVVPDGNTGLIAYRGISGVYNTNIVDGADNNQQFFSEARGRSIGAPYVFPVDAIQEFESSATGYSAELGGAAGGIINAITKSGTNKWHGDLYEYYRTPGWNALDPYNKSQAFSTHNPVFLSQPVKVQNEFGISVGGPIKSDKLFFHFTYDGFRKITPIVYTSTFNNTNNIANLGHLCDGGTTPFVDTIGKAQVTFPTTIPGISPTACAGVVAAIQGQLGAFPRNVKQDIFFPRLDYQLNPKTHLSAEFLWQDFHQPNGYNTNVTVANGGIGNNGTADFHERILIANAETLLTSNATNVVHFQWGRDLETDSTNTGGPFNSLSGLVSFGETSALPRGKFPDEHRWQATEIYSLVKGQNTIKAGFDLNFVHEQIANLFGGDGSFSYNNGTPEYNFANFAQDALGVNPTATTGSTARSVRHYNLFSQTVDQLTGVGADDFWNQNIDGFVEDQWKTTSRLLLSAGVRYDVQLVPSPDLPYPNTAALAATYPAGALPLNPSPVAYNATSQINPDLHMVQPRLGFNWNPQTGTVIRGGGGMFYGQISNSTYYTERRENGVYQKQYTVNTGGNVPYTSCPTTSTACSVTYQNPGTYVAYAPAGGVPIYPPPGPSPVNPVTGAAITPTGLAAVPGSTITIRGLDPSFKNPLSYSWDVTVEQVLPLRSTLTIGYVGNRAVRLPVFVDANVDPNSLLTNKTYQYTNPLTGQITQQQQDIYVNRIDGTVGTVATGFSDVNSNYHSMVTTIHKPLARGVEILANYTWAKAMDGGQTYGGNGTFNGTDAPLSPFAQGHRSGRSAEYARSDLDIRSRFVGTLVGRTQLPIGNRFAAYAVNGWQLSGTYTAQSGEPVTATVSGSISYLTTGVLGTPGRALTTDAGVSNAAFTSGPSARVPNFVAGRNSFKGPGVHNLDARVSREFPLFKDRYHFELAAEAFNLANHRNILSVNTAIVAYLAPGSGGCPAATTGNVGCLGRLSASTAPFMTPATTSNVIYGARQLQLLGRFIF